MKFKETKVDFIFFLYIISVFVIIQTSMTVSYVLEGLNRDGVGIKSYKLIILIAMNCVSLGVFLFALVLLVKVLEHARVKSINISKWINRK